MFVKQVMPFTFYCKRTTNNNPVAAMKNFTKLLLSATLMLLTNLTGTYAQVDQTFWFVAPETTRQHAKTPGILRVTAFDQTAQVRISQPANPDFHPIELTVPAGTQQKVEFHDYGQNITGYNSSGVWTSGLNVEPPRRGDGSLELEKMLSAIENATLDPVTWGGSTVLDHDWPGIASNEPTGVSGPGDIPILNKGLLIESTNGADISVYYEVANPRNPERFNMKGRNALGREFLIPVQNAFLHYSGMHKAREKVDIVATQDGTTVTINFDPKTHKFVGKPSSGSSFSVTLDRGETFVLRSNSQARADHLGGIFVEADKDIAITISDDSIIQSTSRIHYDLTGDQLIPVNIAGTTYIAVHPSHGTRFQSGYAKYETETASVSNQVFIWPVGDPTVIKVNGAAVKDGGGDKLFSKGQFHVEQISGNGIYIETSEPVIVYQVSSYSYELGSAVLPALECTGSRSVSFARVYDENFFIQILTKNKNILNESDESNFQAYYQTEGGGTVDVTDKLFTKADGKTSSGWQLVENTGIADDDEQWYTYVKYFAKGQGFPTGVPITVKFRDNADNAIFSDELFHLSVLDANGASMSYGYFSAYNSVAISAPAAACVGTDIELRTNGVLADWYHESDPITPFEESAAEVHVTNPGTYWVLIPNSSCQSSDPVTIDYIIPNFDLGDDFTACPGDPIELGIDELPYHADYTWTVNGTEVTEGDPWSHSFTAAANSSYKIKLTVSAELYGIVCEHSDEIEITVGPEPFISLTANEAVCAGSELVAEYRDYQSYEWTLDGEIISTENSFVPKEAGLYTLVVRTTDGCEATQDIQVSIHDLPVVELAELMDCVGEKGEFQVSGFPAGSSFRWYNGNTETWSAPTTGIGSTFTATEPMEQIVVEVTDNNGCVATAKGSFGWHAAKVFEQEDIVICYTGEYSIDVDEKNEYGPLTWSYSSDGGATWGGLDGTNQFVKDNSILTITPLDEHTTFSGQYRVEGTYAIDGKNCPVEGEFNLLVEGIPEVTLRPQGKPDAKMCAGGTLTITIDESNLDASNMTYEWGWSDQDTEDPLVTIDDAEDPWIVAEEPGWYFVSVEYGDNMCVAKGSIEVITIPSPTMNADDVWVCPEGEAILSVDIYQAADGNDTPASYEWIKAEPGLPLAPNHPILSTDPTYNLGAVDITNAGFYRVTTFDEDGCFVSNYIEVGMHNVPAFTLDNASICEGETYSLALPEALDRAGGTALWERRNDDATYSTIKATDVSALKAGTHTLRLSFTTDDGCIESAEMTLTVLPAPEFNLPAGDVCEGDDITIIAEDSFSNYNWSMPGNALEGSNEISFTPNANGTVTLTVTDENGCTATKSTEVSMHTLPTVTLSDQTACPDDIITFSVPHDPATHTIIWTLPSGRTIRGTNSINTVEGTYTVTVADQYGCSASASATANWHDFPWVYFGPNLVDVCPFELPKTIAADGDRDQWTVKTWHDGLYEGEYKRIASLSDTVNVIRVMNEDGCWSTASQSVLLALPSQFEAGRDVEACEPVDGTPFEEILEAGEFTYYDDSNEDLLELPIQRYTWFRQASEDSELEELASGEDAREFVATQGGRYLVEVFDGCWSLTDTFNIDLFPSPVIAGIDSTIYQQIVVMAESGTEPYSYTLNNGQPQNDPTFKGLGNGDYTVFVVDDKGCEASTTFRFESSYDIKVPNFFTPNGDGYNDTWLIEGLEKLPESIIYIYDRYGKLLRKYTSNDPAWNGEYLSRPVPSDDYWYVIHLLPVDKLLKGHFTLKR